MANIKNLSTLSQAVILTVLLMDSVVLSSPAATESSRDINWPSFIPREIKMLMDLCMSRSDAGYCLQKKAIDFLDRALLKDSLVLTDGLSFDRSKTANVTDFIPTARQQGGSFNEIVWNRLEKFFNSRVLSINLSQEGEEIEGRKKKKKEFAYYAVAVATAMALLIPLSLKGIAVVAGTALLVGKVALVLAGLSALKHFVHHSGSDDSHRRVHIEDLTDAHNLAYGGYAPSQHAA